nr:glutathione binding-like protein [Kangiella koreensis]
MPSDSQSRSQVIQWIFAALNSVEMASLPWSLYKFSGDTTETPGRKHLENFLSARLKHMEAILSQCDWLAGDFSVADILMADVLRLVDRFDGLAEFPSCRDYVARATSRPTFKKAYDDQMAHFAAAD